MSTDSGHETRRFQTMFETMPLGVLFHDAEGRIEMVNQAACDILGLSREELMGLNSMDPRWRAEREDGSELHGQEHPAAKALATGKPVNDFLLSIHSPRHSGRRWLLVNAVPEFREGEDRPFRAYAAFADVTERREALNALARSEARFRSVMEAAPMGFLLYDLDGDDLILCDVNQTASRILGSELSQHIGQSIEEVFPRLADTEVPETYRQICRGGHQWFTERIDYDDGSVSGSFEATAFPLSSGSMAVIFNDISERVRQEDEREKLIRDLQHKQEELERFTYAVSHDLKSPMITIKGFLGMAEKDMESGDMGALRGDMDRIGNATEKMFVLLADLLEFSRIGRMDLPREEVDVVSLVGEVLELLEGPLRENGVEVLVAPDMLPAMAGRSRLHSVFQNLIENAIKFAREEASARIEIGMQNKDGEIIYHVCDNGIGIEPRHQADIFNLFSKLDSSKQGSGMGLALARRIVENHGGRIWIESSGRNSGTCFRFTLAPKQ